MREHSRKVFPYKDERGGSMGQMITACTPVAVQLRRVLRHGDRRRCRLPGRLDFSFVVASLPNCPRRVMFFLIVLWDIIELLSSIH